MVTPFDGENRIDREAVRRLIDHLIEEQASDSIVVCGTTGESPTLTDEEKLELFRLAVEHAAGRCRIIAGTGSNDTAHSIHLTKEAEKIGADGFLLVTPYYNRPTQRGLYRHFRSIAEATRLPVMLYNVPKRTGVNLEADTVIGLAHDVPNVTSVKEATNDIAQATRIIRETPDHFLLYSGDDEMTLPFMAIGGHGVVSVASHVAGRNIKRMIESFLEGNVKEAAALHGELLPLFKGLFVFPNPVPVKYALKLHGLDVGGVRPPLADLTEEEQATVRRYIQLS
jgi:4-hydroxy-tetrahydrodipicolinate synthase